MTQKKTDIKIGKKGWSKRITAKLTQIRKTPISKDVFRIVDENASKDPEAPLKKIATPKIDLEK